MSRGDEAKCRISEIDSTRRILQVGPGYLHRFTNAVVPEGAGQTRIFLKIRWNLEPPMVASLQNKVAACKALPIPSPDLAQAIHLQRFSETRHSCSIGVPGDRRVLK